MKPEQGSIIINSSFCSDQFFNTYKLKKIEEDYYYYFLFLSLIKKIPTAGISGSSCSFSILGLLWQSFPPKDDYGTIQELNREINSRTNLLTMI